MNSILQDRLDIIKELCKRYKVRSLYSFGSVNTSRFTEHSDIDLLIEFDPSISLEEYADNYFSLRARLVELFKRKIDLVTILSIEEYLGEKRDFIAYEQNKLLRRAVERELEIIGEAMALTLHEL